MNWPSGELIDKLPNHRDRPQLWQQAFVAEWQRLAEGCADLEQTADLALELYATRSAEDPVHVARLEWGPPG